MKVIVCMKAVRSVFVNENPDEKQNYVINPYDLLAIEKAVELKKRKDCIVSCISMGASAIKDSLIRCMALGIDEVFWLNDRVFAGSDTVATSYIIQKGIQKAGGADLVICGARAVDGETGQVGIGIAEHLGIPCITDVDDIHDIDDNYVTVKCAADNWEQIVKVKLPALLIYHNFTIHTKNLSLLALRKAQRKGITELNQKVLGLEEEFCGLKGSRTKVIDMVSDIHSKNGEIISGDSGHIVTILHNIINERGRKIDE